MTEKGGCVRYLLLIYGSDADWTQRPVEELEPILAEHQSFTADLKAANAYVAAEALQPSSTATTIRIQDGAPLLTDGPYTETREQLAGFYLIEAENLDHAMGWARRLTAFDGEPVEVRPVVDLRLDTTATERASDESRTG